MKPWLSDLASRLLESPRAATGLSVGALVVAVASGFLSVLAGAIVGAVVLFLLLQFAIHGVRVRDLYGRAFRTLHADYEWDIEASDGSKTIYRKRLEIEFTHSDVISIWDDAWGDGNFQFSRCNYGIPADFFRFAGRYHQLVSLRERRQRGQKQIFEFEWLQENGYICEDQYVEAEVTHDTREMSMSVIFPKDRPSTRATLTRRSTGNTEVLEGSKFFGTRGGRQTVTWRARGPRSHEMYVLAWHW